MSDCKEIEIIKLLSNYQNSNKIINIPEFPLTDQNIVRIISRNITDIIYKRSNSNKSRVTIIELLKRWTQHNSDFPIDETNYNIFVNIFTKTPSIVDSYYEKIGQEFINISKSDKKFTAQNTWTNICQTMNKKYARNLESKIKSGLLNSWNRNQLEKNNFEFNAPNKTFQNVDVENALEFLENLKVPSETKELLNSSKTNVDLFSEFNLTNSKEEIHIQISYSLLNLERSENNEKMFIKVMKNMSESKTETELKFIDKIWRNKGNLNLSVNVLTNILEHFPHIYERIIINLATKTLEKSTDCDYEELVKQSEIENVLEMCLTNSQLLLNVIAVFNKLLQFSKFDERILKLINIIKIKICD